MSATPAHVASVAAFQAQNTALINQQINVAFAQFAQNYVNAQAAYFNGTSSLADLQKFDADSATKLTDQINQYVSTLSGATSTLVSAVTGPLSGTAIGSLAQQLQAITPVGTNGQTVAQFNQAATNIILGANKSTTQTFQTLGNVINEDLFSQFLSENAPKKRLGPLQKFRMMQQEAVSNQVNQAFTTYFNALNTARTGTLLVNPSTGVSTTGPIDLSGNVSAFNSQLATATINLSNSLTTALAGMKGGLTTLQPSIVQSLFAPQTGLFSQLSTMPTPTDLTGLSAQAFNTNVFGLVNTALQDVNGRIGAFNQSAGTNFSSFNQFGNNAFVPSVGTDGFFTGTGLTTGTGNGLGTGFGGGTGTGLGTGFGGGTGLTSGFSSGFGTSGLGSFFGGTTFNGFGSGNGTGLTTGTGTGIGIGSGTSIGSGTGVSVGVGTGFGVGLTSGNGLTTFGSGSSTNATGLSSGTTLGSIPSGSAAFNAGLGFGFGNGFGFGTSTNGTGLSSVNGGGVGLGTGPGTSTNGTGLSSGTGTGVTTGTGMTGGSSSGLGSGTIGGSSNVGGTASS